MKIWQLKSLFNGYEELQLTHFEEDYKKYFADKIDRSTSMLDTWERVQVYSVTKGEKSDSPHFWGRTGTPVFSDRALEVLGDLVRDHAETLPLFHENDQYYIIHIRSVLDAIDYEKSVVDTLSTGLRVGFDKVSFVPEMVDGQPIFKVYLDNRIYSTAVFVSDEFRNRVLESGLRGFEFIEAWDLQN